MTSSKVRVEADKHRKLLANGLAARDVVDPQLVQHDVGDLHRLAVLDVLEDGVEQRDALDHEALLGDVDAVANVERVLDKQENAGPEDLLAGRREDEGQGEQSRSGRRNDQVEAVVEESN